MPSDLQALLERVERRLADLRRVNEWAKRNNSPTKYRDTEVEEILSALLRALIAKEGG